MASIELEKRDAFVRGYLEITSVTYGKISRYVKTMDDGLQYYCSLPIMKMNAKTDVRVLKDGSIYPICL